LPRQTTNVTLQLLEVLLKILQRPRPPIVSTLAG